MMNVNFNLSWDYDECSTKYEYMITCVTPRILVSLSLCNDILTVDVQEPILLGDLKSILTSVWEFDEEAVYTRLVKDRSLPLKSFNDKENFKCGSVYTTAYYVKITEESFKNLKNGYLLTRGGSIHDLCPEEKPVNYNPIKKYTKRVPEVQAIQYKIHNKKDVESFIDSCYYINGTLLVTTDDEEVEVPYGNYIVKEEGKLYFYNSEVFKELYYRT